MQIIYEDSYYIAVNKKNSELVQSDRDGTKSLEQHVKAYLIEQSEIKEEKSDVGVIHRLDRPASGVVIFGKTNNATRKANSLFRNNHVKKTYWAVVKHEMPCKKGCLKHYIVHDTQKNKSYSFDDPRENAKQAVLNYTVVSRSDNYYLIEIDLITGRHHQVRSQLSKIGSPVKGDLKYGFARSNKEGGICLHARELSFVHPFKRKQLILRAEPPDSTLWNYFCKHNHAGE